MQVVSLRLLVGAALETVARKTCASDVKHATLTEGERARLWSDAAHVAVWTSAHAERLEVMRRAVAPSHVDASPQDVECFLSEYDLTDIFERRNAPQAVDKACTALCTLLQRSTSPGERGWTGTLKKALQHASCTFVVMQSFAICLLGLHPQLSPCARAPWNARFAIAQTLRSTFSGVHDMHRTLLHVHKEVKEAMRRTISDVVAQSNATHAANVALKHPTARLFTPPLSTPNAEQVEIMELFARAGRALVPVRGAVEGMDVVQQKIARVFSDAKVHKLEKSRKAESWLGKGTFSTPHRVSLMSQALEISLSSFSAWFTPLWILQAATGRRVMHLQHYQCEMLQSRNAMVRLCAELSDEVALHVQRAALLCPSAELMTTSEVWSYLTRNGCVEGGGAWTENESRRIQKPIDILNDIVLKSGSALGTVIALHFAKVAFLKQNLVSFDLGASVARLQARAVLRRFQHREADTASDENVVHLASSTLPPSATCGYFCTKCCRMANSHADLQVSALEANRKVFNEIGLCSTMIENDTSSSILEQPKHRDKVDLRCTNNKHVGLRKAGRCGSTDFTQTETLDCGAVLRSVMEKNADVLVSLGHRKRDCRNACTKTNASEDCSSNSFLVLPLLGRVTRVFNQWTTLCTFCASPMKVKFHTRYDVHIACLRCDAQLLCGRKDEEDVTAPKKACRFCGKIDPKKTGRPWTTVQAPHDISGQNALLPPPLRRVHYCSRHWKPWIRDAHRTLETRYILSHIMINARPVVTLEASASKTALESESNLCGEGELPTASQTKRSEPKKSSLKRKTENACRRAEMKSRL
jgi:hypothetical protein